PDEPEVASAHYIRERDDPETAEVAFSVIDEYQHRGIGTLLLGALAVAAHVNGVRRFSARVLADNTPMKRILQTAGGRMKVDDATVGDAELVEAALPFLERGPVGDAEADVVQPRAQLTEGVAALGLRMRVDAEERPAVEDPDDVVEQTGVLVEVGLGVEELL